MAGICGAAGRPCRAARCPALCAQVKYDISQNHVEEILVPGIGSGAGDFRLKRAARPIMIYYGYAAAIIPTGGEAIRPSGINPWRASAAEKDSSMASSFPTTTIGGLQISRLIIGSNPFFGFSHYSQARDEWLRQYFTDDRIYEVMAYCAEQGLNGFVSGYYDRVRPILDRVERSTGVHINWFATPGGIPGGWDTWKEDIKRCADAGAEFLLPHQCYSDNACHRDEGVIVGFSEIFAYARELGMRPGVSSHTPETIVTCEKAGYGAEVYIQPLNPIGFLCQVETDWMENLFQQTPKPFICIKPLGAGRVLPPTGLRFVYSAIKPIDTVCIGMMSVQEAKEDIAIARAILEGQRAQTELQATRSKAYLKKQT